MSVGKRINLLRKQLNLKQNDFANELGIDQGYVSQLENDKYSASLTLLKLISVLFHIDLEWLRNGEGEMFVSSQGGSCLVGEGLTGIHAEMAALIPNLRGKYAEQALEYIKERLKFQDDEEKALPERTSNKKTA